MPHDIDLLEGSEEEPLQLTERLEKTAADNGMEISSGRSKIRVNSIKPKPSTNKLLNGKVLEGWNINKGSIDQTGTGTRSQDNDSSAMEEESNEFSCEDETLQITRLVNTAHRMFEFDADCGSGETSPSF